MFGAQWIGGNPDSGLGSLAIMSALGALVLLGGRGHNGNPDGWLDAIGGLAYLAAIAFFRWRG